MYLDQALIADIISETSMGNESQKVNLKAIMKERRKKEIYIVDIIFSCSCKRLHVGVMMYHV